MEITLLPEDRLLLDQLMATGSFQSEEELIHRSLEVFRQHEEWKRELDQKIAEGLADIERGDLIEDVAIEEFLNSYVRKSA